MRFSDPMKYLRLVALVLAFLVAPISSWAGYVNSLGTNGSVVASLGNTYAPTGGNLLIVVASAWNGGTALGSLTDTRGNTIPSPIINLPAGTSNIGRQGVWIIPNCIGGAGTFTFTAFSGTPDLNLDIYEFSGLSLTGTLDGSVANATFTSGTALASGNITTTVAGSLLFSVVWDQHSVQASVTNSLAGGTQFILNKNLTGGETSEGYGVFGAAANTYSNTATLATATNAASTSLFAIRPAGAAAVQPKFMLMGVGARNQRPQGLPLAILARERGLILPDYKKAQ